MNYFGFAFFYRFLVLDSFEVGNFIRLLVVLDSFEVGKIIRLLDLDSFEVEIFFRLLVLDLYYFDITKIIYKYLFYYVK